MVLPHPLHVSDHNWPGMSSACLWPQDGQVTVDEVNQTSAMGMGAFGAVPQTHT